MPSLCHSSQCSAARRRTISRWCVALTLFALMPAASPSAADDLQAQVDKQTKARELVKQLAAAAPADIEPIEIQLAALGKPAIVALRVAELSGSFDVRHRAQRVGRRLRWRIAATAPLLTAHPKLLEAMASTDQHTRAEMVDAVAKTKSPDAIGFFDECLADDQPYVRQRAIDALVEIAEAHESDQPAALAVLQNHLDSPDENMLVLLASGLNKLKKFDVDRLGPLLQRDSPELRLMVVLALGNSRQSQAGKYLTPMLADPHWRVRASAAEALGNLGDTSAGPALTELLDDDDAFVAKVALHALMAINQLPAGDQLQQLLDKQPELLPLVVGSAIHRRRISDVLSLYTRRSADRTAIVEALAAEQYSSDDRDTEAWANLLKLIDQNANDAQSDLLFLKLLNRRPAAEATPYLTQRLKSADARVQRDAAVQVIRVMAPISDETVGQSLAPENDNPNNSALDAPVAQWHQLLAGHMDIPFDPAVAVACYLTGSATDDLPLLIRAIGDERFDALADNLHETLFVATFKKLPWPEGEPVVAALLNHPGIYAWVLAGSSYAPQQARGRIVAAGPLVTSIEQADNDDKRETIVDQLIGRKGAAIGLAVNSEQSQAIVRGLLDSKTGLARAVGIYITGSWKQVKHLDLMQRGLADGDPQVRQLTVQKLAQWRLTVDQFESLLSPLLWDPNDDVAQAAAAALWAPGLDGVVDWDQEDLYFHYGSIRVWGDGWYTSSDPVSPPIQVSSRKATFLPQLVQWLNDPEHRAHPDQHRYQAMALLAAQYGEMTGIEHQWEWWQSQPAGTPPPDSLIIAPAFSEDPRYMGPLRTAVAAMSGRYELQQALQILRAARSPEARQLRRVINRRIRDTRDY